MFKAALVFSSVGFGILIYGARSNVPYSMVWFLGVFCILMSIPFLVAGIFSTKQIDDEGHHGHHSLT